LPRRTVGVLHHHQRHPAACGGGVMSREKQGYHDTIALLNEMFPDQGMLGHAEVARFLGVDPKTVRRRGIQFNKITNRVTKPDLARQICI